MKLHTVNSSNKKLDYIVITMNIIISVIFIGLLVAAMIIEEDMLSTIVSVSNGVLGIVGISICVAWFYFGCKTSTILMKSANNIKDSCADALDEALTLRKRLLKLTFIIGLCFLIQSIIAILSMIEHLQLFSEHYINFTTIWTVCDIIVFLTFILFYKTHVLRQRKIFIMDQQERELERAARRRKRDPSSTGDKSLKSNATVHQEESQSYGLFRRLTNIDMSIPRMSILSGMRSSTKRKSITNVTSAGDAKQSTDDTHTNSGRTSRASSRHGHHKQSYDTRTHTTTKSKDNVYHQPPTTIEEEMDGQEVNGDSHRIKLKNRNSKSASLRDKFEAKINGNSKIKNSKKKNKGKGFNLSVLGMSVKQKSDDEASATSMDEANMSEVDNDNVIDVSSLNTPNSSDRTDSIPPFAEQLASNRSRISVASNSTITSIASKLTRKSSVNSTISNHSISNMSKSSRNSGRSSRPHLGRQYSQDDSSLVVGGKRRSNHKGSKSKSKRKLKDRTNNGKRGRTESKLTAYNLNVHNNYSSRYGRTSKSSKPRGIATESQRSKSQEPLNRPSSARRYKDKDKDDEIEPSTPIEKVTYGKRKVIKAAPSYTVKMTSTPTSRKNKSKKRRNSTDSSMIASTFKDALKELDEMDESELDIEEEKSDKIMNKNKGKDKKSKKKKIVHAKDDSVTIIGRTKKKNNKLSETGTGSGSKKRWQKNRATVDIIMSDKSNAAKTVSKGKKSSISNKGDKDKNKDKSPRSKSKSILNKNGKKNGKKGSNKRQKSDRSVSVSAAKQRDLKDNDKDKNYDNNKADDEIEKALHRAHSSSGSYSLNSLKDHIVSKATKKNDKGKNKNKNKNKKNDQDKGKKDGKVSKIKSKFKLKTIKQKQEMNSKKKSSLKKNDDKDKNTKISTTSKSNVNNVNSSKKKKQKK